MSKTYAAIIGLNPSKGARSPKLWNKAFSVLNQKTKMICIDIESEEEVERTIKNLARFCSIENRKLFIANDFKLALKMNINGVYLPSFNKSILHNCYKFKKDFKIIGSAHNISEIRIKILQNVKEIFLAPVFKEKKIILGIYGFLKLKKIFKGKAIVLGGVAGHNIKKLRLLNPEGFAAIKYYKKKGP